MNRAASFAYPRSVRGFTLLELLVACAVSVVLLGILGTVTHHATRMASDGETRLTVGEEAFTALEYLGADLAAVIPPSRSNASLSLVPEQILGGSSNAQVNSAWLLFLARPPSQTQRGACAGISYRVVYSDALLKDGPERGFALYRSVLPGDETARTLLGIPDLFLGYWREKWPTHLNTPGFLGDYVAGNVVDFSVTLRSLDGTGKTLLLTPEKQVNWTGQGFAGPGLPAANGPRPESLEVALTVLKPEGMRLFENATLSKADAIQRYGSRVSRVIRLRQ
jgi:prepilin-type N-terminal cleavage/methylation domain-containing protein